MTETAGRLYRGIDTVAQLAEGGQERLTWPLDGAHSQLAPAHTGALLARCLSFLPLDAHAEAIARGAGLAGDRVAALRRRLGALAEAGLLTAHDGLLSRCVAHGGEPAPEPIELVGVPTCDRPDELERALRSYASNARAHGRAVELAVMDDSRRPESRAANAARLQALCRELGARATYADAADRRAYVEELTALVPDAREAIAFALSERHGDAVSTGACRNALLLYALGRRFVHVDDDTVCRVARSPGAGGGVIVSDAHTGMEHRFHRTVADATASVAFEESDYFGLFEGTLGRTVGDVLATSGPDVDLDGVGPALARRLAAGPLRVAATSLGVAGDSGLGSTDMYLFTAHAASRARLFEFPGGYREAFRSHAVVRSSPRRALATSGLCVGIALGLDARRLLPPFMPAGRNSDGFFANTLRACFADAVLAFEPWLVEHVPPVPRRSSLEGVIAGAGALGFPELASWLVRSFDAGAAGPDPPARLRALGGHLSAIGAEPLADYRERCRAIQRARQDGIERYVEHFEAHCEEGPPGWREDLHAYVASARTRGARDESLAPRDLARPGEHADAAIERGRLLVRRQGALLAAWTAIVEAARDLARRGRRPARPLGPARSASIG